MLSRVSYFQRFSQRENHATNNTMLLFRYLYEQSPARLGNVLRDSLGEELAVGLAFDQQIRMGAGVPDALISQEPLRIFVETKTLGTLDHDQILRHCAGIAAGGKRTGDVLVGLTRDPISNHDRRVLAVAAGGYGVRFVATTFGGIVDALRGECADSERELLAIVDDYAAYLADENLLDERNRWVFVNPCGISYEENVRFSLYYEPPVRRLASHVRYMGIYTDKAVTHVGVIAAIAVMTTGADGTPAFAVEAGTLTEEHRSRIDQVTKVTSYYDLAGGPIRFYLADDLQPTSVAKHSSGGMRGRTYLDLSKLIRPRDFRKAYTSTELAGLLRGTSWE